MHDLRKSAVFLLCIAPQSACIQECTGAACGDLYASARIYLFPDSSLSTGDHIPEDASSYFNGETEAGRDWSLELTAAGLIAGQPDRSTVQLLDVSGTSLASLYSPESEDFGASLAVLDGALAVGAPRHTSGVSGAEGGAVYLFRDQQDGWTGDISTVEASQTLLGNPGERFGSVLAACGDLDLDGGGDLLIQAAWGESSGTLAGELYWLPSSKIGDQNLSRGALTTLPGVTAIPGGRLGNSIACQLPIGAADSTPDLVVGAPYAVDGELQGAGQVYVWHGSAGFGTLKPAFHLSGTEEADYFGGAVAVGDLDGDGLSDLVVGAIGHDASNGQGVSRGLSGMAGAVYVYMNDRLAFADVFGFPMEDIYPSYILQVSYPDLGNCTSQNQSEEDVCINALLAHLGASVALADLNQDGMDDLLVGAPGFTSGGIYSAGRLWVLNGPPTAWGGAAEEPTVPVDLDQAATASITGTAPFQQVGHILRYGSLEGTSQLALLTRRKTP